MVSPDRADPFAGPVAFDILLRNFDDIEVIKGPSLLNIRNLVLIVVLLLAIVALVGGWGWNLEHKVRRLRHDSRRPGAPQQFAVDRKNLLQDFPRRVEVL